MNLKIILPSGICLDKRDVFRMVADTDQGSVGILPQRRDCVLALTPGILVYETAADGETYVAVDQGTLIKAGADVTVTVRRALADADLGRLRDAVEREFMQLDELEKGARAVTAKLETGFLRSLAAFQHE